MSTPQKYSTATAFRISLETRLKNMAKEEGVDLQRLRRQVAFDRFLVRVFSDKLDRWVLKGGYAMELRLKKARTTRDIDLTARNITDEHILEELQNAASLDMGDFFVFLVGLPMQDLDAAPYGGARYPVECRMDGRIFSKFHLDVGLGDVVLEPLDMIKGRDWLDFADISTRTFPALSMEQQFSEKLHAYTLPRKNQNSRVRDLVDMVLLINSRGVDKGKIREALEATFNRRDTHALPATLESPPEDWQTGFAELARECDLSEDLYQAFQIVADYFKTSL